MVRRGGRRGSFLFSRLIETQASTAPHYELSISANRFQDNLERESFPTVQCVQ